MELCEGHQSGENSRSAVAGPQEALFSVVQHKEHRTDSLSAAFKNLGCRRREDVTGQYEAPVLTMG